MDNADAARDLPGRLLVAVQMLAHSGKSAGGRAELTATRLTALAVMNAAGPMRMGNLAGRLGIQVSTMSRIIDVLVSSGWAQRRPDEDDHRACVIGITEAGSDLIASVRRSNETRLAGCIAGLDEEDLTALQAALPVLESLAQQATGKAVAASGGKPSSGHGGAPAPRIPPVPGPPDVRPIAEIAILSAARPRARAVAWLPRRPQPPGRDFPHSYLLPGDTAYLITPRR